MREREKEKRREREELSEKAPTNVNWSVAVQDGMSVQHSTARTYLLA